MWVGRDRGWHRRVGREEENVDASDGLAIEVHLAGDREHGWLWVAATSCRERKGVYLVVLFWPDTTSGNEEEPDRLLGWYDPKHTTFKCTVNSGPQSLPTFNLPKLTPPPQASAGIPGRN
jgi:hypothetical protein